MRKVAQHVAILLCLIAGAGCDEDSTSPTSPSTSATTSSAGGGATAALTATRFVAFGDSMTAGEITAPVARAGALMPLVVVPGASYPAQLQQRLRGRYTSQTEQISVANEGRSGELIAGGEPRLAQLLANTRPQVLLLFHGSNDLLDFGAGGVSPASRVMDRMAKDGRLRGARVFIALLPPPIPGRQRSVPDEVVRAFNDELRAIAAGEGAVLVDLYRALSADVTRYIGVDGHHPNEAGYQRIADEFAARIAETLQAR